jgi:copper chaperone
MKTMKIKTTGMHCGSCEQLVQESVSELPGIKKVKANHKKAMVEVSFDETKATFDDIKKAIKDAGYTPE